MADRTGNHPTTKVVLSIYLAAFVALCGYLLMCVWPMPVDNGGEQAWRLPVWVFGHPFHFADELRLLLLVMLSAAVGSSIHATTSFVTYVGNNRFLPSWTAWYVLRPFIGMALALVFYFAIRGGLLSVQSDAADFNPYGIAAVAGLVGLFSKQGTDKLEEVFTTLFRTERGKGDDQRADKLDVVPVKQVMVSLANIQKMTMIQPEDLRIVDMLTIARARVSRLPIMEKGSGRCCYIVHQSLLYRFVAERLSDPTVGRDALSALTLADFLAYDDVATYVGALAAVTETATVGDARLAMERTPHCQDVLVTRDGTPAGALVGWLTNVELTRHLKA